MRKKALLIALSLMLGMTVLGGCQKKEAPKETKKVEEKVKPEEKKEELKNIGAPSEEVCEIILVNKTGKDIKAFSVKKSEDTEFPKNMLEKNDVYVKEEKRYFYYEYEENAQEENQDAKVLSQGYDIQITYADDTTAILHGFPFGEIEEGEIHMEEDVAYITYTSVSTKESVNTKETEVNLKAAEAEAAQKEQEAAKEKEAETQKPDSAPQKQESAPKKQDPAPKDPEPQDPAPKDPEPQDPEPQDPAPEEPEEPADEGDDGCLDDGLFY